MTSSCMPGDEKCCFHPQKWDGTKTLPRNLRSLRHRWAGGTSSADHPVRPSVGQSWPLPCQFRHTALYVNIIKWAWTTDNIHTTLWDVITHTCPNFNDGLAKLPLKLRHGWVITFHWKLLMGSNYLYVVQFLINNTSKKDRCILVWGTH